MSSKLTIIDLAEENDVDSLKKELERVDVNFYDDDRTALHAACVSNAIEAAAFLIEKGINVNLKDKITGAVPLHYCATYNYFELAKLIADNNGDVNITDDYGNSPLWTAVFNVKGKPERLPLVELLLQHGADKNHKNNAGKSPLDFASQVKFQPVLDLLDKY